MNKAFKFISSMKNSHGSSPSMLMMRVVACLLAGAPVAVQAGTSTATPSVSIVITASCTINPATLVFASTAGTSLIATAVNGSSAASVTCTNGSPYSIEMDNGANASGGQRRMISGGNFLSYNLYVDAAHTSPWSTAINSTTCTTSGDCFLGTSNGSASPSISMASSRRLRPLLRPALYTDTVTMTITF